MAPYHILIVIISSAIPENLLVLTNSEQSGPKSAHIRPTIEGLNGVNRLAINGEKCNWLPTEREKKITDYRQEKY